MTQAIPVRPSALEQVVLHLLVDSPNQSMYGYAMVEASGGRLKRGTIYVTLGRMEKKGLITSCKEARRPGAAGLPRRQYKVTTAGRRVLHTWELGRGDVLSSGANS